MTLLLGEDMKLFIVRVQCFRIRTIRTAVLSKVVDDDYQVVLRLFFDVRFGLCRRRSVSPESVWSGQSCLYQIKFQHLCISVDIRCVSLCWSTQRPLRNLKFKKNFGKINKKRYRTTTLSNYFVSNQRLYQQRYLDNVEWTRIPSI